MAIKGGTIITKVALDDKGLKTSLDGVKKKGKRTATDIEKAWKSMGKKSDQTYAQMKANIEKNYNTIKNHAKSTAADIVRAEKAKALKISRINKQQFGEQKKLLDQAKQHWMAYAAAIAGILVISKKILAASMEQEKAEVALSGALKASGEYTKELVKDYADYASGIQKVTTYGDEQVLKLMALQKNLGVTTDRLKQATEMSIGLAAATGRDVQSMAMYIALAEQGEFTMLRRYIPALRSTTDKTEQLKIITEFAARGFLVAQENAKTFSGGLTQLGNLWGDLQERVGNVIVKNQALLTLMDEGKVTLLEWIDQVERWVNLNGDLIAQKTHEAIDKIKDSITALINIYKALPDGVIGAAGVGILARILTGSTPIGRFAAILYLVNTQLKKVGVNVKKLGEYATFAQNPLLALQKLLPGERSFFEGGEPGRLSGAGSEFGTSKENVLGLPPPKPVTKPFVPVPFQAIAGPTEQFTISESFTKEYDRIQEARLKSIQEFNSQYADLGKNQFELERDRINEQAEIWKMAGADKVQVAQLTADRIKAIDKAENEAKLSMYQSAAGGIANTFLQIAQAGGKQSEKMFKVYKAFAMVEATIAGYKSVLQALAAYPPPWSFVMAGIAGAAAAVQVSMIAAAQPPSYDQGGISHAKGIYQTGDIDEAHIPLKGGKIPISGAEGTTVIIHMENPVFQDVATQRQVFSQIAEVIATRVAPGAVVQNYNDDGAIRQMVRRRA